MRVLPVIDLQAGVAVHGRAGQRHAYRPVESVLVDGADPLQLAEGYRERLGIDELYVADLDAIADPHRPLSPVHQSLLDAGFSLWLDAGIRAATQIDRLGDPLHRSLTIVLGLETVARREVISAALSRLGPERVVISLDMDAAVPRTPVAEWQGLDALSVARRLIELGARRLILLDIRRVGTWQGPGTGDLTRRLREQDPTLQIICGGGIRGLEDAERLAVLGCDAVLLATCLHNGQIGRAEIERLRTI